MKLATKHAVITGAGSGIGAAIARRFATEGAYILIVDVDAHASDMVCEEIRRSGGRADCAVCDVGDPAAVEAVFARSPEIDILVNNAGVGLVGAVENTTEEDFDRLYRVNVKGVFHGLRSAIPRMRKRGGGVILNMCSVAAKIGIEARFAYSATKGAVLAMTFSVARDYIDENIRCNCLCPARVHTPFVDSYLAGNFPGRESEIFQKLSAWQPIGRMGTPDEVAALGAFLCSDEAAFITGAAYDIDGGAVSLR
ncbi:MAG: SDR family NAD(P)-dependent oxidoreductase [Verrucomicrobiales bacterium]